MRAPSLLMLLTAAAFAVACGGRSAPEEPAPEPAPAPSPPPADEPTDDSAERDRLERERMAREAAERGRAVSADLAAMINFDYDQSAVRPADQETLDRKAAILVANPGVRLRIVGHADERGSDEYNLALGNRRAASRVPLPYPTHDFRSDDACTISADALDRRRICRCLRGKVRSGGACARADASSRPNPGARAGG